MSVNNAMIAALTTAGDQLDAAYEQANHAGYADIAADIRRAKHAVVAAVSKCAQSTIRIIEEMPS
jgi:hypothetical protein